MAAYIDNNARWKHFQADQMCFMCFIVNKRVVLIYLDCEQSVNDYLQSDEKNPVIPKRWRNEELQPRACWNGMTACTWIYYLHPSN